MNLSKNKVIFLFQALSFRQGPQSKSEKLHEKCKKLKHNLNPGQVHG